MADSFPPPAFFKVLLDPSLPHTSLPHAFVSTHLKNKIPKNPTLESATGGYSWQLTIEKVDKIYCFTHGWKKVVEDAQLGFGDFLVFRLVNQSVFRISIFGPNGCERYLTPSKIKVEDLDDDDDDVTVSDDVIVNDDDDDGIVNDDDEEEDEDEDDEEEDEENDDDDDGHNDDDDDDGHNDDDDDDDVDDGGIDGDEGDPFFMTTISKTHNTILRLPSEFVELAGIGNTRTITLKNLDDKEWQLGLRSEKLGRIPRYFISAGWSDFRRKNELLEGDECAFKYIKIEGKLSLVKVTKKKPVVRKSPVKIPAVEVVQRKRGRPVVVVRQPPAEVPATDMVRKRGRPFKSCSPVETVERIPSKKPRVIFF